MIKQNKNKFLENSNFRQKVTSVDPASPLDFHSVGTRPTTLPSVTGGVDQPRIVGHTGPHMWTQSMLYSDLLVITPSQ